TWPVPGGGDHEGEPALFGHERAARSQRALRAHSLTWSLPFSAEPLPRGGQAIWIPSTDPTARDSNTAMEVFDIPRWHGRAIRSRPVLLCVCSVFVARRRADGQARALPPLMAVWLARGCRGAGCSLP